MKLIKRGLPILLSTFLAASCIDSDKKENEIAFDDMIVRIAEIEIDSSYLEEYIAIIKEESETSAHLEPEVVVILPMFQKDYPTEIQLLEIYANQEAYEAHVQTPHFSATKRPY